MTLFKALFIVLLLAYSEATPYISGGTNVNDGDIPYQAFIRLEAYGETEDIRICTGTLIKPDVILTSATCAAK